MTEDRQQAGRPQQPGLTLVAYYGQKPPGFSALLEAVQELAQQVLGDRVRLRSLAQVHATVLGLQDAGQDAAGSASAPQQLADYLGQVRARLDLDQLALRFGGYRPGVDYGLTSRGETLWERSFVVSADQIVVIGWPWRDGAAAADLVEIRRLGEQFGFQHKYHGRPADTDPDAYLVLADLNRSVPPEQVNRLLDRGRLLLQQHPVTIPLSPDDVCLVEYVDTTLPLDRSTARPLTRGR